MEKETKTMKKKKTYVKPEMHVEVFTPDQLVCNVCWNFTGTLSCDYGSGRVGTVQYKDDGVTVAGYLAPVTNELHGTPCSSIKITAKNGTVSGTELGSEKANVSIYNVSGIDWSKAGIGVTQTGITWNSDDIVNHTGKYNHSGKITFDSAIEQVSGRPNHS